MPRAAAPARASLVLVRIVSYAAARPQTAADPREVAVVAADRHDVALCRL
jgi:hypothetical protein